MFNETVLGLAGVMVGFLVSILLPGYVLNAALFGHDSETDIAYRIGLGGVTGLVLTILVGTAWMLLFGRLRVWVLPTISPLLSLGIYGSIRLLSRGMQPTQPLKPEWEASLRKALGLVIGLVLIGGGVWAGVTLTGLQVWEQEDFTELWVLGPGGTFSSHIDASATAPQAVRVGIVSHEAQATEYALVVRTETELLDQLGPITLESGDTWEDSYSVDLARVAEGSPKRLVFELHKDSQLYRLVYLAMR